MTIGEAINTMQDVVRYWDMRPTERAAAALAVQALKEKQARQNPKTYGDRIRAMTDEELTENLCGMLCVPDLFDREFARSNMPTVCTTHRCDDCTLKFLQQPAKEAQT